MSMKDLLRKAIDTERGAKSKAKCCNYYTEDGCTFNGPCNTECRHHALSTDEIKLTKRPTSFIHNNHSMTVSIDGKEYTEEELYDAITGNTNIVEDSADPGEALPMRGMIDSDLCIVGNYAIDGLRNGMAVKDTYLQDEAKRVAEKISEDMQKQVMRSVQQSGRW